MIKKREVILNDLNKKVKSIFGVNLKDYRDDEVTGDIIDLITFPKTVVSHILQCIGIGIIVYIMGFFIVDSSFSSYIIYLILGLILNLLLTSMITIYTFIGKIKEDLIGILSYGKRLTNELFKIPSVKSKLTVNNYKILSRGVIVVVVIPSLQNGLSNRIPIIGTLLGYIVTSPLNMIADRMVTKDDILIEEVMSDEKLTDGSSVITKYIDIVLSITQKPFYYIGLFLLILNVVLIYNLI